MLDLMYPNIMKLTAVMATTMFLMRTELVKEAMTFAMTPTMLASLVMVTMVMVTTVMASLTILVAMTAMMDLTIIKLTAAMATTMFLVGTEKRRRQRCLQ